MREFINIVEDAQRDALNELFSRHVPWQWLSDEERKSAGDAGLFPIVARFNVDGFSHPYYMCFEPTDVEQCPRAYSLFFGYDDGRYGIRTFPVKTGTAFSVYPTLIDIISDFVAVYGPDALRMRGQTGKQTALYRKIAVRLLPQLPGWRVQNTYDGVILNRDSDDK